MYVLEKYPNYRIEKDGRVYNIKRNSEVKPCKGIDGYSHIMLYTEVKRNRLRVHRLMALVFFNSEGIVNHKDSDKTNNNIENLEIVTNSENVKHAYDAGAYLSKSRLGIKSVNKENGDVLIFRSLREAESTLGIDRHRISNIIKGKTNNHTKYEFFIDK